MKDPSKGLRRIISRVDDARAVNHEDVTNEDIQQDVCNQVHANKQGRPVILYEYGLARTKSLKHDCFLLYKNLY